ncbi:MAG: hypothetical protein U9Q03_04885 [Patescibacteria group bacterium]|nr:hypothetical protein [Patescibacteria group bacterium]
MARLNDDTFSRGFETVRVLLGHPKFTAELATAIRKEGGADRAVEALLQVFGLVNINPFKQTVEEQLAALREMNGFWKDSGHPHIGDIEAVCTRLAETALEWPEGRDAYRSFRIRFGKGRDGVIRTFEAHADAVKHAHDKSWRWDLLLSGEHPYRGENVDRLRLLNGNGSLMPVVEWIIIPDLSAHRKRNSVTSVRRSRSLADEGLVLAWLVPDRVRAIDYNEWCAWFCAGYEINVPEYDAGSWQCVPIVYRDTDSGKVHLDAYWHSYDVSHCSVPSARE